MNDTLPHRRFISLCRAAFWFLLVVALLLGGQVALHTAARPLVVASTYPATLRVIEVRYMPDTPDYDPDWLSAQLQLLLRDASSFHKYLDPDAQPIIQVEIVDVYNHNEPRPNPDGTWYGSFAETLARDGLCERINTEDIDQIWLWVDPVTDPAPGEEYAISSQYFKDDASLGVIADPPFCGGQVSFVFMGFDTTRTPDLALHSIGHMLEALLGHLQADELFWQRYSFPYDGSGTEPEFPLSDACGNVHFPPNGEAHYDYDNPKYVDTFCEDWNPQGTGIKRHDNCSRWGCTQEGFLLWWMQNMPNRANRLIYQGRYLPNWWDFSVDMDEAIQFYLSDQQYFMNRTLLVYPYTIIKTETDPVQIQGQKDSRKLFDGISDWPNTAIVHQVNEDVGVLLEFRQPQTLTGFQVAVAGISGGNATYTWKVEKADTWQDMISGNATLILQNYPTYQQGMVSVPFGANHTAKVFKITASRDNGDGFVHLLELIPQGNFPPDGYAGLDQSVAEGDPVTLGGVFADPNPGDTHTFGWSFGDGTVSTGGLTVTHIYADDGIFTATLTITDNLGATSSDALLATTVNVSPTLSVLPDPTTPEDQVFVLSGTFIDPGLLDAHQMVIVWQPGLSETLSLPAGIFSFSVEHIFADPGIYSLQLTLTDDDGGGDTGAITVTVTNVNDPLYTEGDVGATAEDMPLALDILANDTDPDGDGVVSVVMPLHGQVFNDGSMVIYTPTLNFNGFDQFTYVLSDGEYSATATVSVTVTPVNDVPQVGALFDQTVRVGEAVTLTIAFTDPDAFDLHTIGVTWSPGVSEAIELGVGVWEIQLSHLYTMPGSYPVMVTVSDDSGQASSEMVSITVSSSYHEVYLPLVVK